MDPLPDKEHEKPWKEDGEKPEEKWNANMATMQVIIIGPV